MNVIHKMLEIPKVLASTPSAAHGDTGAEQQQDEG
jgi:hypothetical protein